MRISGRLSFSDDCAEILRAYRLALSTCGQSDINGFWIFGIKFVEKTVLNATISKT